MLMWTDCSFRNGGRCVSELFWLDMLAAFVVGWCIVGRSNVDLENMNDPNRDIVQKSKQGSP